MPALLGIFHGGCAFAGSRWIRTGEIGADLLPAIALIAALQQILRAEVEDVRVLGREDYRRSPCKTECGFCRIAAKAADCLRRDDLGLAGTLVIAEQLAEGAAAVEDVGIAWVGSDVTALARTGRMPVAKGDGTIVAAAGGFYAARILLRAVDVVRKLVINRYMVELRRRLVVPGAPDLAAIDADADALVAAKDHALGIRRIDPQGMIVVAAGSALNRSEGLSSIRRPVDRDVRKIDRVGIHGIDDHFAEVPEPSANALIRSNQGPGLPGVIRAEEAALSGVDQGVDAPAVRAPSYRQTYAPPIA